jgi:bla regulator protein BlaR1
MGMLNIIFSHILYSSLMAGVIIVLFLVIKKCCPHHFPGRVYHMMWLLVLIRLLIPFDIESPYNINNIFPENIRMVYSQDYIVNQLNDYSNIEHQNSSDFSATAAEHYHIDKTPKSSTWSLDFFSIIWLAGFLSIACFAVLTTLKFKQRSKYFERVHDPEIINLVDQCCAKLGIKQTIPLYKDSYFHSPCIAGVVAPSIYLPPDICTPAHYHQLEHILLHELVHYKRKDLLYSFMAAISAMIHWFNPLVWLAIREMKYDREIACDAYVMELLGEASIIPYGNTLIKLSGMLPRNHTPLNLAGFNENHQQIARRITMIKMFKKGSYKIPVLAAISFILVGVLVFTAGGCFKPENNPGLNTDAAAGYESTIDNEIKNMLVIIDPGHGGEDLGGTYPLGSTDPALIELKEKDLNLQISLLLYDLLKESGIPVEMTRSDDRTVELQNRIESVNQSKPALLISVHNEMHPDESVNGTRTFYYSAGNAVPQGFSGEKAAGIIQTHLVGQLKTTDLGISNNKFKLLDQTRSCAVIAEISYLTNESDRQNLRAEKFRIKAAQALHDGIIEVLTEMAKTQQQQNQALAGTTDLQGEGVVITLDDGKALANGNSASMFHDLDILTIVNQLCGAGAEAIAVNDERIIATSEISCSDTTIMVNNQPLTGPYVIKAIGPAAELEKALLAENSYVETLKLLGMEAEVETAQQLVIPKYKGKQSFNYAQPSQQLVHKSGFNGMVRNGI